MALRDIRMRGTRSLLRSMAQLRHSEGTNMPMRLMSMLSYDQPQGLEVSVSPHSTGNEYLLIIFYYKGTRERHLESILQSSLSQIILIKNFPRSLFQIVLQIESTPENDYVNTKLVQGNLVRSMILSSSPRTWGKTTNSQTELLCHARLVSDCRPGASICCCANESDCNGKLRGDCVARQDQEDDNRPFPERSRDCKVGSCIGLYISR